MSASIVWLIFGSILLALEALGIPGVGLLFLGLGALATAIAVESGVIASGDHISQFASFLLTSGGLAILLWKRLKAWRIGKESYSNMIGDAATAGKGGLVRGKEGTVHWSGTTMRAVLAEDASDTIAEGSQVTITAVKGTLVIVK